jgi:hypothetical protein
LGGTSISYVDAYLLFVYTHAKWEIRGWAGIGRSITRVDQIADLQRPLNMEEGGVVLMDLLWSDPTMNDAVEGVQASPRGPGLVTFGPDRVSDFCKVCFSLALISGMMDAN